MSNQQLADRIVEALGGVENIIAIENCMTRLRVNVKDGSLVKRDELSKMKEVLRVVGGETEPQIVLGPGVAGTTGGHI